ncbi:IS30 family transposase [Mycoplasmopsis caviae]|uniref:Transposase n=1 Tax=Mycoplasmopsis caviae TaxID=55603 RepID=A0A3P8LHR7_9BACT|nr:IS30 family transposase [Mycoplasmopsis caviae]UUD35597.1 IS30 family transposase [Mycoplasmopsis caviae]VDR41642.1 transposase [Mycoplasmopsis caviae]
MLILKYQDFTCIHQQIFRGIKNHFGYSLTKHYEVNYDKLLLEYAIKRYAEKRNIQNPNRITVSMVLRFIEIIKRHNNISSIANELNCSKKTVRKLFNKLNSGPKFPVGKTRYICSICEKKNPTVQILDPVPFINEISNYAFSRTYFESKKIQRKWVPILTFYSKLVKNYNKNKNCKDGKNKAIKMSVRTIIDEFKKVMKEGDFCPKPVTFYKFLQKNPGIVSLDILPYKSVGKGQNKKKKTCTPKVKTPGLSIHLRPESINQRMNANDYEMDTVVGLIGIDYWRLLTLINRKTRMAYAVLVKGNAKSVKEGLLWLIKRYNLHIDSLTIDNGIENRRLDEIECIGQIYHTDSYASNQKGSIENMHKFIRYFVAKGKSFNSLTNSDVQHIMFRINSIKRYSAVNYPSGLSPIEFHKLETNIDLTNLFLQD